ncbi:MAG: mechanosensitive ion channel, partial [Halobacteriales archaeon]|nr:mechanosensitive ion channel [Halobacteriales archaeon]
RLRGSVRVGVGYGADPAKVKEILERAAREHPDADKTPGFEPTAYLEKFGESSVDFVLKFFHHVKRDRDRNRIPGEVQERIYRDLTAAGIDIPLPQRVITVKGDVPPGGLEGNGGGHARTAVQERKGP